MFEKLIHNLKYKYNPKDPSIDPQSIDSRQNWILFAAHRDGKFPVSEVYDKFNGLVSRPTINKDFLRLEDEGLIKREKDRSTGKSYIIPLFKDSGIAEGTKSQQQKAFAYKWGLPILAVILACIFIGLQIYFI